MLVLTTLVAACVTGISAQDATADKIRPVSYTQKGNPPSGPNQVVIEHDQGLATHTIYRPANLTAAKYPLRVWGEGGCAKNGLTFPEYLSEIASYGFVIDADDPPVQGGGGPVAVDPEPGRAHPAAVLAAQRVVEHLVRLSPKARAEPPRARAICWTAPR